MYHIKMYPSAFAVAQRYAVNRDPQKKTAIGKMPRANANRRIAHLIKSFHSLNLRAYYSLDDCKRVYFIAGNKLSFRARSSRFLACQPKKSTGLGQDRVR